MSMRMDAGFEMEQIGTLFVRVGSPEGGLRGWVVPQGCSPQKVNVPSKKELLVNSICFVHIPWCFHGVLPCILL